MNDTSRASVSIPGSHARLALRDARPEDLDRMMKLEEACFQEEAFSRSQYRRLLRSPTCRILLLEEEGGLQGMLVLNWRASMKALSITSLAVHPDTRGKGLGTLLLKAAEAAARELGRQSLVLEVGVDNRPALTLYERSGFAPLERMPDYYGRGRDAWRMGRELD